MNQVDRTISPARAIDGIVVLPGDKSISHRYGMLAAVAQGTTRILNYATGADCQSTLSCMEALGARVSRPGDEGNKAEELMTIVEGGELHEPTSDLDAGNSGTITRMLTGILAGQEFTSRMFGDESVTRRPVDRVTKPLTQMGAHIELRDGRYPPLVIHGRPLHGIEYTPPVASAQVKSCVLLAGLFASGDTVVQEPVQTRDHTEIALREFGADIEVERRTVRLRPGQPLIGRELVVPGDLSSACFFLVAALMAKECDLAIRGVGLNPTRSSLLDFLVGMGAPIKVVNLQQIGGELMGDLRLRRSASSALAAPVLGGVIEGALTAALIDEIPALAVLGATSEGGLTVRDAAELRVKETDRIETVAEGLRRMGVTIETTPDGFHVPGKQKLHAAEIESAGDHRIAMAFSIAALAADGPCTIQDAAAASVSFPTFFDLLDQIAKR
ncbi:MAG: 3-phosphoshikimate 1-carboxyvinyltransferase [Acidobacteriota bacterium]